MKMTKQRVKVLGWLNELEINRRALHNFMGHSCSDLAHKSKLAGAPKSVNSMHTYLVDLELMGFAVHEQGVGSSWRITEAGRLFLKSVI